MWLLLDWRQDTAPMQTPQPRLKPAEIPRRSSWRRWRPRVVQFLAGKNLPVQSQHIAACHTLPRKQTNAQKPPTIIIRFVNTKHKSELLRQGLKLKGTGVYLKEHLTKKKMLTSLVKPVDQWFPNFSPLHIWPGPLDNTRDAFWFFFHIQQWSPNYGPWGHFL